ncbi:hypothetical protein [Amycolatopsis sp. cmx-4-54]|uniref:hypothetical protein n=1 Tax=Amycolatopsis sp. cmx-4-54 TaxID=2790936 RepID=UPI003978E421
MTRHNLTPADPALVSQITVGWDRALRSYFGVVIAAKPDDDGEDVLLVDVGIFPRVTDPQEVLDKVAEYTTVPSELLPRLKIDAVYADRLSMSQYNEVVNW